MQATGTKTVATRSAQRRVKKRRATAIARQMAPLIQASPWPRLLSTRHAKPRRRGYEKERGGEQRVASEDARLVSLHKRQRQALLDGGFGIMVPS